MEKYFYDNGCTNSRTWNVNPILELPFSISCVKCESSFSILYECKNYDSRPLLMEMELVYTCVLKFKYLRRQIDILLAWYYVWVYLL